MQISANPDASTMMIAAKASDLICGRTGLEAGWSDRFAGLGHGVMSAPLQHADGP